MVQSEVRAQAALAVDYSKEGFIQYKTRLLAFLIMFSGVSTVLRYAAYIVTSRPIFATYIMLAGTLVSFFIMIYRYPKEKIGMQIFKAELITASVYILNYIVFARSRPYYSEYMNELIQIFIIGIPCAVLLYDLEDPKLLLRAIRPYVRIISVLIPVIYLFGAMNLYSYMEWGNRCYYVALLYFLCYTTDRKSNHPLDIVLLFTITAFSTLGGRQSFVFLFLGIILIFLLREKGTKKALLLYSVLLLIGIIVVAFYREILDFVSSILAQFNISSRALSKLADETLFDASNRESIYSLSRRVITNNGAAVSGLFADRFYLRQYHGFIAYAHNFIYEILIDFGLAAGAVMVLVILTGIFRGFIHCKKEYRSFFATIMIISVAKLTVSSSFLIETGTFVFIGLLFNKSIKTKTRRFRFVLK